MTTFFVLLCGILNYGVCVKTAYIYSAFKYSDLFYFFVEMVFGSVVLELIGFVCLFALFWVWIVGVFLPRT